MTLVKQCMPKLATLVRNVRERGTRLKDIEPDMLMNLVRSGEIEYASLDRLCETFGNSKHSARTRSLRGN